MYFSSGGKLHRATLSSERAQPGQITSAGDYDRFASPSGDGERLIFLRQKDDAQFVIEHTLATGDERVLIRGDATLRAYRP